LLSVAAVISLALGLFQDFGTPRKDGEPPVDWVEGVAIMIAVAIVVSGSAFLPILDVTVVNCTGYRWLIERLAKRASV
jgi:hypothetical protein